MDNVGVEGRVFYTMLFSLKRYFSVLSGSEGRGYLDIGSGSSSSGSSSGDHLDASSGSGRKRWRLSRHQ